MKDNDVRLNETVSPKTPGGISKTHLTPIRRLGLSRKWKKSGGSPFVSPLTSNTPKSADSVDAVEEKSKKRRLCVDDENIHNSSPISEINYERSEVFTPTSAKDESTLKVSISRKKSKIILYDEQFNTCTSEQDKDLVNLSTKSENCLNIAPQIKNIDGVPANKKSSNNFLINGTPPIEVETKDELSNNVTIKEVRNNKLNEINDVRELRVPNNLTKECIVVIQNKIIQAQKEAKFDTPPQVVSDSDSDDVPLSHINNKENKEHMVVDDDFIPTKSNNSPRVVPVKKTESISSRKSTKSSKKKIQTAKSIVIEKVEVSPSTQSSNTFDEDDDDFEVSRKTILVSKSYDKVAKPVKAKSTGSITQKDIDELKAKIEMKKRLLLAKAMSEDTKELRDLIKKWQKGCQDALMELLELMKNKLPDRRNMDYGNILQMLKIPPELVGYDEENDCFNTPDDNSILAATFKDL